jgi:OmcA/MtrC family decaheme c-type cytochrome
MRPAKLTFVACRPYSLKCTLGALFTLLLAACSGSTGPGGPAGTAGAAGPAGPPGPTGPVTALNVSTATQITATITSVTIPAAPAAATPVVKLLLLNQVGQPLSGLKAAALGFIVAKLVPSETQLKPVPPQTVAPAPQISSQWQSYIYTSASPAPATTPPALPVVGTTPQPQATTEAGTAGMLVDNGDGTYQYTFAKDISKDPAVTYDATLTHRVGLEIRGLAAANSPVYSFQPSSGATTGIAAREIVDDQTCKNCHMQLAFHGGARTEVQYCVMCHNPSSIDPSSGNSLDFKIMFHKIHMGANLPSVQPPPGPAGHYDIFGHGNSISDFSAIVFPTGDLRTCYICHNQADTATPQTVNWQNVPSIEACGSCHDDVNFQTGVNHSMANLGNLTDADCATCHGPTATISHGSLQVAAVHVMPIRQWGKQFAYNVKSVSVSTTVSKVTFSVTDPTVAGHVWNILTDEPFTYCTPNAPNNPQNTVTNVGMLFAWSTTDYTNTGSVAASEAQPFNNVVFCGSNPAGTPVANGDGTFTVTLPPIPAGLTGSAGLLIDGVLAHDFNDGNGPTEIPVTNVVAYAPITDTAAVPRRDVVDVAKCDVCHDQLNGHGGNRVDSVQACTFCHNPNATDIAARAAATPPATAANAPDGMTEEPIDLKYMIHALHDGNVRAAAGAPYVVYHRGNFTDFRVITPYPGALNNCLACHLDGTYYPQDPTSSTSLGTTVNSNGNSASPAGQLAMTAATSVCSACHVTLPEKEHMMQNGGSFSAVKSAASQVVSGETCIVCHGAGAIADVAVVHKLSTFQ